MFGGCGSAIFASQIAPADNGQLGILLLGVSLAFGLSVLTMAYAVGHISGGHFNLARSLSQAVFVGGQAISQLWLFWVAPILGAVVGGLVYKFLLQKED